MLDERGLVRDEILKRIPKGSAAIYYHIIAWTLFIIYEVSLSGAILGSYNHFSDYLFHYPLYIILFYVNCYLVLGTKPFKNIADYSKLLAYLLLEFVCYYGCNMVINTYLESSGWPVTVIEPASRRFNLGTLYRFIYIVGLSSAFRTAINLLKSQKRNLEFVTETLTREKETEKLRNELLSTELSYLRARVEPHFLFGTLTSLHHRVRKKDAQTAEYVLALADLMRYSLQTTAPSDMVPVEMELEHINNYMDLQQMRFHTDIDFRITADDKELEIIPRLLNSLIENVFSHGECLC